MTERESFVDAIAANPDDDTPRLAFADWLEEHGDAVRAGFVRDSIRLARLRPDADELRTLSATTGAALRANLSSWMQDACEAFGQSTAWDAIGSRRDRFTFGMGKDGSPLTLQNPHGLSLGCFARGFLEAVQVCVHCLADGSPLELLLRVHPITRLRQQFVEPHFPPEAAVVGLKRIRSLSLIGETGETSNQSLFQAPIWTALKFLDLASASAPIGLSRSPLARRLHGLRLTFNQDNLKEMASFPLDDTLYELAFVQRRTSNAIRAQLPDLLARLFEIPVRPTLKRLLLNQCHLGDAGLALFARGSEWIRLRALALDRNRFGDPGWRDFVRGRRTPELRTLTASRNFLTDDGAIRLVDSPLVETLEFVDLRGNRIGEKGALALARRFAISPLKKLRLAGNPIRETEANTVRKLLGARVDIGK